MSANPKKTKPEPQGSYRVRVEIGPYERAVLDFTARDMAQQEYNRLRAAGVYCGRWITRIEFNEPQ